MKLFLTSNGISTDRLIESFKNEFFSNEDLKSKSVAVVVNAEKMGISRRKSFKMRKIELQKVGFSDTNIYFIDLLKLKDINQILKNDIIYLSGGDPPLLSMAIHKSNAVQVVNEFLNQGKVIIGRSAGSMVCAKNYSFIYNGINSNRWFQFKKNVKYFFKGYAQPTTKNANIETLNLFNKIIYPHFDKSQYSEFNQFALKYEQDFPNEEIERINDGDAIVINGEQANYRIIN